MTRQCAHCRECKPLDAVHFGVHVRSTGGFRHECRPCRSAGRTALRLRDVDAARAKDRAVHAAKASDIAARRRERYAANQNGYADKQREYAAAIPRDRKNATVRRWRTNNPDSVRDHNAKRNPLNLSVSALIRRHLRTSGGSKNRASAWAILGYSVDDLRLHLESQFRDGMSWGNYGAAWELDHRTPLRALPATSVADDNFRKAWALANLQPLTVHENRSKGGRILELAA